MTTPAAAPAPAPGVFSTWAAAGFGAELVLVEPRGKKPVLDGWQKLELTTDHAAAWDRRPANVGVRCRAFPAIDVDADDQDVAEAVVALAFKVFGATGVRQRAGSARCALLYRLAGEPFSKAKVKFKRGDVAGAVEVLADGQQLVVAGVHASGAPLAWAPCPPAAAGLAPMDLAGRDRFVAELREVLAGLGCEVEGRRPTPAPVPPAARRQVVPQAEEERARSALEVLDPDCDYDTWVGFGMALHDGWPAEGGTGFRLWDEWSARGSKYPGPEELAAKWRTFKAGVGVGLGTLIRAAQAAGWRPARTRRQAGNLPAPSNSRPDAPGRVQGASADDLEDVRTAGRLVERARGRFLWVYREGGGAWHGWDGRRWGRDDARAIYELATEVARSLLADAANEAGDRQKALIAAARKAQHGQRIEATVRLAASAFPDLKAPASSFDADDWVLNTPSGLVDLRTGKVRACRPEDRVTMLAPVEYDPEARHTRFERFLEEVLPSPEVRAYVRRAAGYSLTGSTREHAMFLPVGGGRNGKGVLMRLLLHAAGDYGRTAAAGLLLERHGGEAHLTELAALEGARFVFASEVPPRSRWNEPRLKQLVGGDPVAARLMRQDLFTFQPRCKVWLAMNERPRVVSTSDAIWARLKEIRFPVQFRDADDPRPEVQHQPVKDLRLEEQLLPGALPAVLAWAVAGAVEWCRHGLGEPPEVRAAVAEYRRTEDRVGPFLEENPITEKIRLRDLFKRWKDWCAEVDEKAGTQNELSVALQAKGYEVRPSTGKVYFVFPIELPLLASPRGVGECPPPDSHLIRIARARETLIPDPAPPHSPTPLDDGPGRDA